MVRWLVIATLAACLAGTGCDRGSPPQPPVGGGSSGDEQITGNERIGWDQPALDRVELSTFRYAVYVDGLRSELSDASCAAVGGSTGFPCTAKLPPLSSGQHILELAAFIIDGGSMLESGRSGPFRVFVTPATSARAEPPWNLPVTTVDGVQLRLELVADGLDRPTDLAFAPDGRMFVGEQRGRIRILGGPQLRPRVALTLQDVTTTGTGGLLAVAVDPQFERTHFVYVVYTTMSSAGDQVFRLARFREANDTLADRAILLDEIPASSVRPSAALRFGLDGKLYATFDDAEDLRSGGDLASFNGKILRLNKDGSTPEAQAIMTPVYSHAYHSPRGLDWQSFDTLWIADAESQETSRLIAVGRERHRSGRGAAQVAYAMPPSAGVSSIAFYPAGLIQQFGGNLFVAAEEGHYILRLRFDPTNPSHITASEHLIERHVGGIRVVTIGPEGAIYFGGSAGMIGRLVPGR